MKKIFLMLLIMLPVLAMAQSEDKTGQTEATSDSMFRVNLINHTLDYLYRSWYFGYDTMASEFNVDMYKVFKDLFYDDEQIINDIDIIYNPEWDSDKRSYKPINRYVKQNVDSFATAISMSFISLKIDTTFVSTPVFDTIKNTASVTMSRVIKGAAKKQYVIRDFKSLLDSIVSKRKIFYVSGKRLLKSNLSYLKVTDTIYQNVKMRLDTVFAVDSDKVYYKFEIKDKVIVNMILTTDTACEECDINDTTFYKITLIDLVEDPVIICTNDSDNDGIIIDPTIKDADNCPQFGDFTAFGCPDYDFDSTPNDIDFCDSIFGLKENCGCPQNFFNSKITHEIFIGGQFNSVPINLPELNQLGYRSEGNDAMDVLQSEKGSLTNPDNVISMMVGANFNRFFGRQKNMGISLGLTYSFFSATYSVADPIVYTFKSYDVNDFYRRRVTINKGSTEKINYNILNIPLLFKCRWMKNSNIKWQYQLGIGPSFLMFQNTSNYDVNIDFEGLYQIDTSGNIPHITYYDPFDLTSDLNVYVVADSISSNPAIVAAVFDSLNSRGYDFESGKRIEGKSTKLKRNTFALNIMFDISYELTNRFALKLGFHFVYAPLFDDSKNYFPIDKRDDPYNSLYNSKAKSNYFAYGINAGIIFSLK